jgi:hypothetical protein
LTGAVDAVTRFTFVRVVGLDGAFFTVAVLAVVFFGAAFLVAIYILPLDVSIITYFNNYGNTLML